MQEAQPPIPKDKQTSALVILIVDDDESARQLVVHFLKAEGYEVHQAVDGVEALRQMEKTRYDLIISDILMPQLDGLKLLEIKVQKRFQTPILFVSAKGVEEIESKIRGRAGIEYMEKPVHRRLFLERVKRLLEKQF